MKKYRVRFGYYWMAFGIRIVEVEVEKETKAYVWVKGRRHAKRTGYEDYFDTWDKAKAAIILHATKKCEDLRRQLERHELELENAKRMSR